MERLELRYKDALKSQETLKAILKEPFSIIVRDATIQRFEYTFEALWKFLKDYLREKEGVISNSPKSVFREIFLLGFFTEEESITCLDMTDKRNDTSHTYKEEMAQIIYSKVQEYANLIDELLAKFKDKIY